MLPALVSTICVCTWHFFDNAPSLEWQGILAGDFEIDRGEIAACDRLEACHPDAQIWIIRIGSRYVRRFGGRTNFEHL